MIKDIRNNIPLFGNFKNRGTRTSSPVPTRSWTYKTELEEGIHLSYEDFLNNPIVKKGQLNNCSTDLII